VLGPSKKQLWRQIREERAQHRLEIENLLDRLADAHDKPWTLPPRPVEPQRELTEDERAILAAEADLVEL
jgi:hypothetical protein